MHVLLQVLFPSWTGGEEWEERAHVKPTAATRSGRGYETIHLNEYAK